MPKNGHRNYPIITDELINCLKRDFPDKIPRYNLSEFLLGTLVGQQLVIDKLIHEKSLNEDIDDDFDVDELE